MTKTVLGTVHGSTIELTEPLGFAEGQQVEVQVTVVGAAKKKGEGITRSAGALVDDAEWDGIMDEIQKNRKVDRRSQVEEL